MNYDILLKKITFICAKFGTDLINTSKVTSSKNKVASFLAHPVWRLLHGV